MSQVPLWVISYPVPFVRDTDLSRTYRDFLLIREKWTPGRKTFMMSVERKVEVPSYL